MRIVITLVALQIAYFILLLVTAYLPGSPSDLQPDDRPDIRKSGDSRTASRAKPQD